MYDYIDNYVVSLFKDPSFYNGELMIGRGQMRGYKVGDDLPMEDYGYSYPRDAYLFIPKYKGVDEDEGDATFLIKGGQLLGRVEKMTENLYVIDYNGALYHKGTSVRDICAYLSGKTDGKNILVPKDEFRTSYYIENAIIEALKTDDLEDIEIFLSNPEFDGRQIEILNNIQERFKRVNQIIEGVDVSGINGFLQQ